MSLLNSKYLLVFNHTQDTPVNLLQQVKRCRTALQQQQDVNFLNVYLLYVTPKIPNFALCTPEMIRQFHEETTHAKTILDRLGDILNIPESRRFLRMGMSDWQARVLAKELSIKYIIGQSETFQKVMAWLDKAMKHLSLLSLLERIIGIKS